MPREYWEPVDPSAELKDLVPISVLVTTDQRDDALIAEFFWSAEASSQEPFIMRFIRTNRSDRVTALQLKAHSRIGEKASELMSTSAIRIVALPPVQWSRRGEPRRGRLPIGIALALTVGLASPALGGATGAFWALPLAAAAFGLVWLIGVKPEPMRILVPGDLHLDASNVVEYARRRELGERPEQQNIRDRRASIHARVEDIKAEYGRLSTDVVYRIENSALFDSSEDATERFQAALIRWDTNPDDSVAVLEELAGEVEVSFAVAQDHAETVGLSHLPSQAQDAGRRASNAARLAQRATTEGERLASMRQVARILDALALYYLPRIDKETLALEAPTD